MKGHYINALAAIGLFLLAAVLFVGVTLFVSRLLRPHRPGKQKGMPYESGEEPQGTAWPQFNLRFYVIAILFLLFEVEVVFIFPWAVAFTDRTQLRQSTGTWGWFALVEMTVFVLVLALGLAYAWVNGHLDWIIRRPVAAAKSSPVPDELYEQVNQKYAGK